MAFPYLLFTMLGVIGLASAAMVHAFPSVNRLAAESSGRYQSLDALRGLLAASVVVHHACIARQYFVTGEWVAPSSRLYQFLGSGSVAVFFMITGLLFWGKAIDGRVRVRSLLSSRLRRIMPLYLFSFMLVFTLCMHRTEAELRVPATEFAQSTIRWLAGGLLGQPSINGVSTTPVNAGVNWTLQYEWLFYLLLPALAYLARLRHFLWLMAMYGMAIIVLRKSELHGVAAAMMTALPFAGGMVVAYLARRQPRVLHVNTPLASCFIVVSLVMAVWFYAPRWQTAVQLALVPAFALVALGNEFFALLRWRFVRWLGHISFSVYLLHGIVLMACLTSLNDFWPVALWSDELYTAVCAIIGAALVSVSTVTYLVVERPFISGVVLPLPFAARS